MEKYAICLKDYRLQSFLSIEYVHGDLCKHLGIDSSTDHPDRVPIIHYCFSSRSSTDHPDRYSNIFQNAYINRHVHAECLKMI